MLIEPYLPLRQLFDNNYLFKNTDIYDNEKDPRSYVGREPHQVGILRVFDPNNNPVAHPAQPGCLFYIASRGERRDCDYIATETYVQSAFRRVCGHIDLINLHSE